MRRIIIAAVLFVALGSSGCGVALPNNLRKEQIKEQQRTNALLEELIRVERDR